MVFTGWSGGDRFLFEWLWCLVWYPLWVFPCRVPWGNQEAEYYYQRIGATNSGSSSKGLGEEMAQNANCDQVCNETSLTVLNTGRAYNSFLLGCLRELEFVAAKWEFHVKAVHIPGGECTCIQVFLSSCMIVRPEVWMEINLFSCRGLWKGGAEEDQEGGLHPRNHSKFSSSMEKFLVVLCIFSIQPSASHDWVFLPVCTVLKPFFQGCHINSKLHQWGTHAACLVGCALSRDW